ncbi:MAG: pyrrolo-quinoline quinone [Acidobacteria bacterium]|nr:MAG: pyrrolo-quinoline quinone [Acidobacteriota bacterium]REK05913.1 MAG: pyrrolo-quinoline quinone [Acidobacteriota bacterium]
MRSHRQPVPKISAAAIHTIVLILSAGALAAADWPEWRGASRDASTPGAPWADSLSGLEVSWSVDLGKGYPGPVVLGNRVFVVETVDSRTEQARALDRSTGEELWRASWQGSGSVPFFARKNGDWVRSTPAVAEDGLYVGGMQEVLRRLDPATGEQLWAVDLPQRFGTGVPEFGFASSPLLDGDGVIVQAADSVVRLDRRTGETVWRSLASAGSIFDSGAFSSPVIAELAGRRQLVVQTREALHGLDPLDGTELWRREVPNFRGMNILTPVVVDARRVLTSSYRNRTHLFEVRAAATGGGFEVEEIWSHKAHAYMSSPVVHQGHAYIHLGNRRLTCIALDSGETQWTSTPFGEYWSVALRGDRLLALDSDGTLLLLRLDSEELELLDRRSVVDEESWAHVAVAGDQIFVRGLESLVALNWPRSSAADPGAAATSD